MEFCLAALYIGFFALLLWSHRKMEKLQKKLLEEHSAEEEQNYDKIK